MVKCVCCNCPNSEKVCRTCRTTKFITGNNAVKKYKITKTDIYDYYHGPDALKHFIYGYKYLEHYLITDIEDLAVLKHTDIDGIRFLQHLKRNDDVANEIKVLHQMFPTKISTINETKKKLLKDNKLNSDEIIKQIKEMCKNEEKIDCIINEQIMSSLCTKEQLIKESIITKKDYDLFSKNTKLNIFNELSCTQAYKDFFEKFNYSAFNKVTVKKINFVELFKDNVKHIIQNELDEIRVKVRTEEFTTFVKELISHKNLHHSYVTAIGKIKKDYILNKKSKVVTINAINKLVKEINEQEKNNRDVQLKNAIFSIFINQYKYNKSKIMDTCYDKFMNDVITIGEMRIIADEINNEYLKNVIDKFDKT